MMWKGGDKAAGGRFYLRFIVKKWQNILSYNEKVVSLQAMLPIASLTDKEQR